MSKMMTRHLNRNPDAMKTLATVHEALMMIEAYSGKGISQRQVVGITGKAMEMIKQAWCELGFDDLSSRRSKHSDFGTRITACVDPEIRDQLIREFRLYSDE
jgi:hypothetical protein